MLHTKSRLNDACLEIVIYPNTYLTGLHTYIIDPVCRPHLHSLIESPPYLPTSSTYLAYLRTECKTVVEMVARMNASVAWDLGVA